MHATIFKKNHLSRHTGFTALEVIVTISLLSFFLLISTPKLQYFYNNQEKIAIEKNIYSMIIFAKTLSTSSQHQIQLCGSSNTTECDGKWSSFILARYYKKNGSGTILRVNKPAFKGWSIQWQGSLGNNNYLLFYPNGTLSGQRGSFYINNKNSLKARLTISQGGIIHSWKQS